LGGAVAGAGVVAPGIIRPPVLPGGLFQGCFNRRLPDYHLVTRIIKKNEREKSVKASDANLNWEILKNTTIPEVLNLQW
jgi:hypothetical protein